MYQQKIRYIKLLLKKKRCHKKADIKLLSTANLGNKSSSSNIRSLSQYIYISKTPKH